MKETYTLEEIAAAMKEEGVGPYNARYTLTRLQVVRLAGLLDGKLSDPKANYEQIAKHYFAGFLGVEDIVRMAHGNNMNVVHDIVSEFKRENL
jgi:hypothetical protein